MMTEHRDLVVDFRARPNLVEYDRYLRPRLDAIDQVTGGRYGAYRAATEDLAGFVDRLDRAGIDVAVFAARSRVSTGDWSLTNDVVADAASQYPDRIVGLAGIDISDMGAALREVDRAVGSLGLRGVCIDPFQLAWRPDDPRLDPLYAAVAEHGVLMVVTMGAMPGVEAPLACGDPLALDDVAARFPDLSLVGSHAGWPFTQQMIAVAWRRRNVYFENSFYHHAPGASAIVEAANDMIGHKILYASAYPFSPLEETLERFRSLPLRDDVRREVLGGNACSLLPDLGR